MPAMFARYFLSALLGALVARAADNPDLASLRDKALHGNAIAQYNLGIALAQGQNTAVDLPDAYAWLTLAGEQGSAGKALETLLGQLGPAQLAVGERRLTDLRAQIADVPPPAVPAPEARSAMPQFSRPTSSGVTNATVSPSPTKVPSSPNGEKNAATGSRSSAQVAPARSGDAPPTAQDVTEMRAQLAALSEALARLQVQVQHLESGGKNPSPGDPARRQ